MIYVTGTTMGPSKIEPEALVKPQPYAFNFTGEYGTITTSISHDYLNAFRLVLIQQVLYPRHEWNKRTRVTSFSIPSVALRYEGYGPMTSDTVGPIEFIKTGEDKLQLKFTSFSFDVSPFIIEEPDGSITYLPPYYYYVNKSGFIVTYDISNHKFDSIIETLNQIYPYERFSRLNRPALSFIRTEEQKL